MSPPPPTVAVITRTLDRPVLLRRTLESLLAQTFRDWHWVVVSPDPEAIRPLMERHGPDLEGRITLLRHEDAASGSRGRPLNRAIEASASEFLAVLDDDDTWNPAFLERMIGALRRPPGDLAAGAICQTLVIEESPVSEGLEARRRYVLNPHLQSLNLAQLAVANQFCIHAFVYRRSALEEVGGYPEDYPVLEDWHFNLRFLARHEVVVLPEPLSHYHQRPGAGAPEEANSIHSEAAQHRFHEARLINSLIRDDLLPGHPGLGPLLATAAQVRPLLERLQALEGRLLGVSDKTGKIDARTRELRDALIRKP